ncbi:MAG: CBS domain-containing protein [Acidobacteria bacterium]|nr:CBS domain-containing protein [Acidobacteriota bacterium]
MIVKNSIISDPLTVAPDTTISELIHLFIDSAHESAAVIDANDQLLGMIGVHDIFKTIVPYYVEMDEDLMNVIHAGYFEEKYERIKNKTARDLMVKAIDSVEPNDAVIKAVALFVHHRRKAIPVIEGNKFIGMITRSSVLARLRYKLEISR